MNPNPEMNKPSKFRTNPFKLFGKTLQIAGLAGLHNNFDDGPNYPKTLAYLKNARITKIFSLEEFDPQELSSR